MSHLVPVPLRSHVLYGCSGIWRWAEQVKVGHQEWGSEGYGLAWVPGSISLLLVRSPEP